MTTVLVSGGFDPLHVGHLNLFDAAASYGQVLVALNTDDWLRRKKGYVVMPHGDRTRILKALTVVTNVMLVDDADGTVCQALRILRPDYYANGGDRPIVNRGSLSPWAAQEHAVCKELGIEILLNVGGAKTHSSSEMVARV